MSILSSETHSTDNQLKMKDETLRNLLDTAAAAAKVVAAQKQLEQDAANLESLEREHARRVAIEQAETWLNDTLPIVENNLKDLRQQSLEWQSKIAEIEAQLNEVTRQRDEINEAIVKNAQTLYQNIAHLNNVSGKIVNDFSQLWQQLGGNGFNLLVKHPGIEAMINQRRKVFYSGNYSFFKAFRGWFR